MRECLRKLGITPPAPPSSAGPPPGGGLPGSGSRPTPQLPKGMTQAQFEAALKNCGGGRFVGPRRVNRNGRTQALNQFAACMRANGVKLPAPNTSGNGPVFNVGGLDTNSAGFRAARSKCSSALDGAFGPPRAGGAAPPGAAEAPPPVA
jgi:hypothetical protein